MTLGARPVCERCTRAARTVDTPSVKVRVERCLIWRDADGLHLRAHCHGDTWERGLPESTEEDHIEALTAFGGP